MGCFAVGILSISKTSATKSMLQKTFQLKYIGASKSCGSVKYWTPVTLTTSFCWKSMDVTLRNKNNNHAGNDAVY